MINTGDRVMLKNPSDDALRLAMKYVASKFEGHHGTRSVLDQMEAIAEPRLSKLFGEPVRVNIKWEPGPSLQWEVAPK